jgi:hypothetical protein
MITCQGAYNQYRVFLRRCRSGKLTNLITLDLTQTYLNGALPAELYVIVGVPGLTLDALS